jgi:outer membrane protein assembly factor BamE (lipoprotein component of BamABCDE complex)
LVEALQGAMLQRGESWFTAFAGWRKAGRNGDDMTDFLNERSKTRLSGGTTMPVAAALFAALALAGCSATDTLTPGETLTSGYVIDEETLALVPVGSSREQVLLSLGTPSTTATFDSEVFYYISQTRHRPVAFMQPRVVDQRVLAVYFGADGRVSQIANYGLQDGRVFDFISRTTPTAGRDQNFIQQLISGVASGGSTPNPFGNR